MERLLITGTGRSGTQYISVLLSRLGLQCRHQYVFPGGVAYDPGKWDSIGESSCMAAPFLEEQRNTLIIHQVRHPLRVLHSMWATLPGYLGWFHPLANRENMFYSNVRLLLPEIWDVSQEHGERCAYYWLRWNQLIEGYAHRRVRVEEWDDDLLSTVLGNFGLEYGEEQARMFRDCPTDVNTKGHRGEIELKELGRFADEVVDQVARYGYQLT